MEGLRSFYFVFRKTKSHYRHPGLLASTGPERTKVIHEALDQSRRGHRVDKEERVKCLGWIRDGLRLVFGNTHRHGCGRQLHLVQRQKSFGCTQPMKPLFQAAGWYWWNRRGRRADPTIAALISSNANPINSIFLPLRKPSPSWFHSIV